MTDTDDYSSLEQLRSYECADGCEFFQPDGTPLVDEHDAEVMLGGDENGTLRCIDCGAELEQTIEAAMDMLDLIAERMGHFGQPPVSGDDPNGPDTAAGVQPRSGS